MASSAALAPPALHHFKFKFKFRNKLSFLAKPLKGQDTAPGGLKCHKLPMSCQSIGSSAGTSCIASFEIQIQKDTMAVQHSCCTSELKCLWTITHSQPDELLQAT